MAQVRILPDKIEIEAKDGESILEASLRAGAPHVHACGGHARCSTCRVALVEGAAHCLPRNEREQKLTGRLYLGEEIRLACQTLIAPTGQVTVRRLVLDDADIQLTDQEFEAAAPGQIGDERHVGILFADIRDFTTLSEALPAYDVVHLLNRYYAQVGRVIEEHGGVVNTYMGDGFMALFGLEKPEGAALAAVRAGLSLLRAVEDLRPYVASAYDRQFRIGVGVHFGEAVVGRIGAAKTRTFTAIGDAVNFASRIESANKSAGTELLISEATYAAVQDEVVTGHTFTVPVKGKAGEYRLYEVRGLRR